VLARIDATVRRSLAADLVDTTSQVGGGALPTVELATAAVALGADAAQARALDTALRAGNPPVVARVADDRLLVDCRTVLPTEVSLLATAVVRAATLR
jgi:L-seryl-tRNA(Ser) seleniumtransferase